jgi:hypothetical protein
MGQRVSKLVPTLQPDGSVKSYDPESQHVWIQHIDGKPSWTMKVKLSETGIKFVPNPSKYYVLHTFPSEAEDLKMMDENTERVGESATLFEIPGVYGNWTVDASQNSHSIKTGLKINLNEIMSIKGTVFTPDGGRMDRDGASGPKGSMTKPGSKYGTSQDYAGVMTKNPLGFLPSFAFIPLPSYLPSMGIFGEVSTLAKLLKEVVKAYNDTTKE